MSAAKSRHSSWLSAESTFYTKYSSSISTAVAGAASAGASFVSANSQSLHNDYTSAAPQLSSLASSLKSFEATVTPPPNPFAKRDPAVTLHRSSWDSALSQASANAASFDSSWDNAWDKFDATWSPPPIPTGTWTVPAAPTIVWDKRGLVAEAENDWHNVEDKVEDVIHKRSFVDDIKDDWKKVEGSFKRGVVSDVEHEWQIVNGEWTQVKSELPRDLQSAAKKEGWVMVNGAWKEVEGDVNKYLQDKTARGLGADIKEGLDIIENGWTPPAIPSAPSYHWPKRAVFEVSPGVTCYGQATVTMTATNAASAIASATSAAEGKKFIANSSGGSTILPTSTHKGAAPKNTREAMLAVGGAAIAVGMAMM